MSQASTMTADELRARLKALQIRQVHFAEQLGVDTHTVKRWVNGNSPVPRYVALVLDLMVAREADQEALLQSP